MKWDTIQHGQITTIEIDEHVWKHENGLIKALWSLFDTKYGVRGMCRRIEGVLGNRDKSLVRHQRYPPHHHHWTARIVAYMEEGWEGMNLIQFPDSSTATTTTLAACKINEPNFKPLIDVPKGWQMGRLVLFRCCCWYLFGECSPINYYDIWISNISSSG